MKIRESGMPSEDIWQTFFSPVDILQVLGLGSNMEHVVELGCGYGIFTIPAAQLIIGTVHAFDIEPDMVEKTKRKAGQAGLRNISLYLRDFISDGTGLPDACADYVMLFNLLHTERPEQLLCEGYRILAPGGMLGIMHWNADPQTPRGPPMDIRPKPTDCCNWAVAAGYSIIEDHIDLPPYHYGLIAQKGT